jgi:ABC-type glucose/galactose transport system permease subunit
MEVKFSLKLWTIVLLLIVLLGRSAIVSLLNWRRTLAQVRVSTRLALTLAGIMTLRRSLIGLGRS